MKKALITGITGQDGTYLAELLLAVEAGLAREQQAAPDALGGPDLPVLRWLTTRFASAPVLTREEP